MEKQVLIPYDKYQQLMKREAIEKNTTPHPGMKETQHKIPKGIQPPPGKREPIQRQPKQRHIKETTSKQQKQEAVPWISL